MTLILGKNVDDNVFLVNIAGGFTRIRKKLWKVMD